MTDSMTDSKTSNSFLNYKSNITSWDYDSDSDSDGEPVLEPVLEPVPEPVLEPVLTVPEPVLKLKTWAKLPEPVLTVLTVPEPVTKPKPNNSIRTLMVKNLPRDTTPEKLTNELRSIFKGFGPIKDVYIPINRDGQYAGTIKGFAKVQFHDADHSAKAVSQSITIRKNKLAIEYAKEDR